MSIEVRNVTKRFGAFTALDDVSVSIPTGSLTALLGCEAPRVVDCTDEGRFVEADGVHFCVYERRSTARCPRLLPVEHELPWGGHACAEREHDPLPPGLCVMVGPCGADAGGDP